MVVMPFGQSSSSGSQLPNGDAQQQANNHTADTRQCPHQGQSLGGTSARSRADQDTAEHTLGQNCWTKAATIIVQCLQGQI